MMRPHDSHLAANFHPARLGTVEASGNPTMSRCRSSFAFDVAPFRLDQQTGFADLFGSRIRPTLFDHHRSIGQCDVLQRVLSTSPQPHFRHDFLAASKKLQVRQISMRRSISETAASLHPSATCVAAALVNDTALAISDGCVRVS